MDETTREHKKCPFCAEWIKAEAVKCKHCGEELPSEEDEHLPAWFTLIALAMVGFLVAWFAGAFV